MHNKFYQKAKKRGKRVVPVIMAAAMLLQTGMSNVVLASDVTGEQMQTEGEAYPAGETIAGEIPEEGVAETTTENPVRDAIDWTQNTENFKLSADKVVYREKEQKQVTAKNIENKIDMSQVIGDTVESQHLFIRFAFDQEKMAGQLLPGDYFSFTVPKEYIVLTDTTEPVAAFVCNQQAYEAETSELTDTEAFGTYTVKENTVTFTVTEIPASGNLFGVLDLAFQWNQQNITAEGTTCGLNFQAGTQVQIQLPKKAEEVKEDKEKEPDTEKQPDAEKHPDTENQPDAEKQPDTENKVEAEQPSDSENQPKAEGSDDTTKSEDQNAEPDRTDSAAKDDTDIAGEPDAAKEKPEDENIVKRFYRSVRSFFAGEETNQNYAGGTTDSHVFAGGELPDGFAQVKVSVYNKKDGYKQGDDLRVRFKFDLILDEDYLYQTLENDLMRRADYPVQGNMTDDEYEVAVGNYLNELMKNGELAPLEYSYDLGDDFRGYANDEPITLYDSARMACGEYVIIDGVVTFNFYGSCYFYDDIVASISMEAELDKAVVSDDPIDVVFGDQGELVHQSTGTGGGGSGDPEDNNYYIEKSAPARVSNSEITYTVTAGALADQTLKGLQIVDILPDGLEVKSVTYGGKELAEGTDYTYDADSRTLTYSFKEEIKTAELTIVARLSDKKYGEVIQDGGINTSFTNTAELKKAGEDKPLEKSEEVTTNMKFDFLSKVGQEEQLNGARYSWTITANTQLPYLDYGYLVDTLCWTDHRYDFESGIAVHTKTGDVTYKTEKIELIDGGDLQWSNLSAAALKELIGTREDPFYYLYDTQDANPFYVDEITTPDEPEYKQMAVLVLPLGKDWVGTEKQEALRVKYFTDLNLHGLSMDDYLVKVKDNADLNPEIKNKATLLWENKGGEGPDPVLPDKVDWGKDVHSNVEALTKSGTSYNPSTQELTWKLDVNRYGASLTNVVVEDVLEDKYDADSIDKQLVINMKKYDQSTKTLVDEESSLRKVETKEEFEANKNTYMITTNDDGKRVIRMNLGDLVSWDQGAATHYYCVLDFKLKLVDGTYLANQGDNQISNRATISATLNGKPFNDTAEATFKIPNRLIDKTAVGSYDYQTHKLTWQIEINPNKLPITNAKITDTLPENITWAELTDIKKNGTSIESSEWDTLIEVQGKGPGVAAIAFKGAIQDTYTFIFESEVTQAWRDANKDSLTNPEPGYAEVVNTAELTGEIYGESITNANDTATHVIEHMKVGKSGVYNREEGTIDWTVLLNVDQVNIRGMYLVEDISAANDVHELDVDSVKVENVQIDENGNVSEVLEEVTNPDLRTIDPNAVQGTLPDVRGFAYYLPDEDNYNTYRITFTTDLQAGAANASIENKVYLKNRDNSNYDESDTNDGGYDGSFDAKDFVTKSTRPKITMTKASSNSVNVEAENKHLLLGHAEFSLIAYNFTTESDTIRLGTEVERYDKIRLTDTSGKALFLNIKATSSNGNQLLYKLEETTPPAGYEKVDDYYIIFDKDGNNYESFKKLSTGTDEISLIPDDNFIVKKASGTTEETTATLTLKDKPTDTEFTFGKEIATGVTYDVNGTITYAYSTPTEGAVVFKVEPTGDLAGLVKTQYIANDAAGNFTFKGLDAGIYTLTEVKSPSTITIGATYTLEVKWNTETQQYGYTITGTDNHNTILDTTGNAPTIKNGYLLGNFSFTKQVKYQDGAMDNGENPNGNVENLSGVVFKLKSTKIAGTENDTFEKIVESDERGTVSFTDIPVGEYTLQEGAVIDQAFETTVSGYEGTPELKVEVKEVSGEKIGQNGADTYYDKKVEVTYSPAKDTDVSPIDAKIYSNTAIKGSISFTKVTGAGTTGLTAFDASTSTLAGAEFGLYRKIKDEIAEKPTYKATSSSDGKVEFASVEYGDYILKEMSTPVGYETMAEITLNRNDYAVKSDNTSFSYEVIGSNSLPGTVKNDLKAYSIPLTKIDTDGNPLADKTFTVYRRNGQAIEETGTGMEVAVENTTKTYYAYTPKPSVTSDLEGKITLDNLPYGDYLLVEKAEGIDLQKGAENPAVRISIGADDKITVHMTPYLQPDSTGDDSQKYYDLSQDNSQWEEKSKTGDRYHIVNNLKYAYVQVNKTAANVIGEALTSTGQPLAGATFAIYQGESAEGTPYLTLTTDKDGHFTVNADGSYTDETSGKRKHLFYGTYTIKETSAPEGFKANTGDVTFTINKDCGHEGTVWVKTNGDGTLATTNIKANQPADDSVKGFFGNELSRGAFSLKKTDMAEESNVLHDAQFHVIDGENVVAILTEDKDTGIYKLAQVPEGTDKKQLTKTVGGIDIPYLFDVDPADGEDYRLLVGPYTVKEVKAPAGYEISSFSFALNADGRIDATITDGDGIVELEESIPRANLADKPISLEIDKRALTLDGTPLQGAEFTVTGNFTNPEETKTISLTEANTSHRFKPNEAYVLKETKAPFGYLKGKDVTIKFNEKGEIAELKDVEGQAVDSEKVAVHSTVKDKLIYADEAFEISLNKVDATDASKKLVGVEFSLRGKFADDSGELKPVPEERTVTTSAEGDIELSSPSRRLAPGQAYSLRETAASDGYIFDESITVAFTVDENGKVQFTETEDITGNGSNMIVAKNHRIAIKLQKRDATDGTPLTTATVTLKDVTDTNNVKEVSVPIDEETVTYENSNADPFLIQGHTYEVWENESGTPTGYETPSEALVTFTVNANGTLSLTNSKANSQENLLVAVTDDGNKVSTVTVKNERKTGEIAIHKVDAEYSTVNLKGAVFNLYKDGSGEPFSVNGSTDIVTGDDGKITVSGLEWGAYVLKEIVPPTGYEISEAMSEGIKFTIGANSLSPQITSAGAKEGTVENSQIVFTLTKVDEGEAELGGAIFNLQDITSEGGQTQELSGYASHTLVGKLIAGHTYELKEADMPRGYMKETAIVQFKVLDNGTIEKVENEDSKWTGSGYTITSDKKGIRLKDNPIVFALKKTADSETGAAQKDVEFKMTPTDDSQFVSGRTELTGTTDADGIWKVEKELVPGKTYKVTETKALAGYTYASDFEVSVGADGKVSVGSQEITVDKPYSVVDQPLDISIYKKDDTSDKNPIGGIAFILTKNGDTTRTWNLKSDADGKLKVADGEGNLSDTLAQILEVDNEGSTYTLTEVVQPDSPYVQLKAPVQFTVNRDGEMTEAKSTDVNVDLSSQLHISENQQTLDITNIRTSLSIEKQDANGLLEGAELGIYKAVGDGKAEIGDIVILNGSDLKWTSSATEAYSLRGLPTGTYWLKETGAPTTYVTADPIQFEITNDGTVNILNGKGSVTETTITMTDELVVGQFTLTKTQTGTETKVAGAVFDLYKQESDKPADTDMKLAEGITTGADGTWTSESSEITRLDDAAKTLKDGLLCGNYYLKETSTPDEYQMDRTAIPFTIEGNVEGDKVVQPDAKAVTAENELYSRMLSVEKQDKEDQTLLSNATFSLTRIKDAAGTKVPAESVESVEVTTDSEGKATFTISKKGTYKLSEIAAPNGYADASRENPTYEKEFVVGDDTEESVILEAGDTKNVIANERKTGTLTLMKQDGADKAALDGVTFTLYKKNQGNIFQNVYHFLTGNTYDKVNETEWSEQADETGKLTIGGLTWGEYYVEETSPLPGYVPDDTKYEFTIGRYQSDIVLSVDKGVIKNTQTEIRFNKTGLFNESCADVTLGKISPDAMQVLEGITFTAYTDANATEQSKVAEAVSDAKGDVVFKKLPVGTYYIKETALSESAIAENYKLNEGTYKAVIGKNGQFAGLQTVDGAEIQNNTIVNDVNRTDIVIEKVDEKNPGRKLPGSTYGLFRRASTVKSGKEADNAGTDEWVQVAQATTDENGILRFTGILVGVEYQIRELIAPAGSYVSEKPLTILFEMKDGKAVIKSFDDGNGTTTVDPETGEIIWKEPQVEVKFAKKDEEGKLLAGAKLEVHDKEGNIIESWTSSSEDVYTSRGKLVTGNTYKLIETEAPEGYEIAEPIDFTIPEETVGPNENKVIQIEMIDKKTPKKPVEPKKPAKKLTPAAKIANAVKTGDFSNIWGYIVLLAIAAVAIITGITYKKKRR